MAKKYYVHTKAQDNGDYEVHGDGCSFMPKAENRSYLGEFNSCHDAVKAAEKTYSPANGCRWCSNECHTT